VNNVGGLGRIPGGSQVTKKQVTGRIAVGYKKY
jgi:hypothetical protein